MPGYCYHFYFSKLVFQYATEYKKTISNESLFYQGNILPDIVTNDWKSCVHMKRELQEYKGFEIPDLLFIRKQLLRDLSNPLALGIYAHLYLDARFITEFLIPNFIWDYENEVIINPKTGYTATIEEFFGYQNFGLYAAYTSINPMLMRDYHLQEIVDRMPEELAMTGIPLFDEHRKSYITWKQELQGYLKKYIPYTGKILEYPLLTEKIAIFAKDFVVNEIE